MLILLTWVLGALLVLPYHLVDFGKQLIIYSSLDVALAVTSLIITTVIYKKKYQNKQKLAKNYGSNINKYVNGNVVTPSTGSSSGNYEESSVDDNNGVQVTKIRTIHVDRGEVILNTETPPALISQDISRDKTVQDNNIHVIKQSRLQQKAAKSFLYMLVTSVCGYFPSLVVVVYVHSCQNSCDCLTTRIMHNIAYQTIIAMSFFRPMTLLITHKNIRSAVWSLIPCNKNGV